MVKVLSPCLSLEASGSLAGAIVFSRWKGRAYVRQLVRPTNPRSAAQMGMRMMLKFLSQAWKDIGDSPQATWEDMAKIYNYLKFNAFIHENQMNWRENFAPSQEYPADRALTPADVSGLVATGGVHNVSLAVTLAASTNVWGTAIYRDTEAITGASWDLLIAVIPYSATSFTYVDSPLAPGTYHYRAQTLSTDGKVGTLYADQEEEAT